MSQIQGKLRKQVRLGTCSLLRERRPYKPQDESWSRRSKSDIFLICLFHRALQFPQNKLNIMFIYWILKNNGAMLLLGNMTLFCLITMTTDCEIHFRSIALKLLCSCKYPPRHHIRAIKPLKVNSIFTAIWTAFPKTYSLLNSLIKIKLCDPFFKVFVFSISVWLGLTKSAF